MPILKRSSCVRYPVEGGGQSGWLPLDTAAGFPEATGGITVDVTIEYDPEEGFILAYVAREDPSMSDDMWFGSLSEAERAAEEMFGIGPNRWKLV